ncbi:hypothetical protein CW304_28880 [Bacillus sp. UFRGS-B20]|nr:hypothetical protein CW304_28880 [Bacillus sp. UFRGS-B20]
MRRSVIYYFLIYKNPPLFNFARSRVGLSVVHCPLSKKGFLNMTQILSRIFLLPFPFKTSTMNS